MEADSSSWHRYNPGAKDVPSRPDLLLLPIEAVLSGTYADLVSC